MNTKVKILILLALAAILVLGNKLREFSYDTVPNPGEVADEYSYGWVGLTLIKDRYPTSWSSLASYKIRSFEKINVDGIYGREPARPAFPIVKPWFDHPPLFGLVTGGYSYLKGARDFVDVSVIFLRRPMIKIAAITTILIFILGYRLYGFPVGLLSALLYSVIPTIVISSRLALMENGFIPLFLGALICADLYFGKRKKIFWVLAVLMVFVAMLFKLSSISIGISLILLSLVYGKKDKKFLVLSVLTSLFAALISFALYGAYYDWEIFVATFMNNSQRFYGAGAEIILSLVSGSRITTTKFLTDGWIILGWISFFLLSFTERRKSRGAMFLTVSVLSYAAIFILFGSESYGWYKLPFYPFLIIALARILERLYQEPNLLLITFFMFLPFGSILHRLLGIYEFQKYVPYIRILAIMILGLFFFDLAKKNKIVLGLERLFFLLVLAFVIWLSIREIFFYSIDKWYFVT